MRGLVRYLQRKRCAGAALASCVCGLLAWACAQIEPSSSAAPAVVSSGPQAVCAACHAEEARELGRSGAHGERHLGLGCLACHAAHEPGRVAGELGPAPLVARCEDCHAEVLAQFALPFRHPLGASVACTSCHPAHGMARRELARHVRHDACAGCHEVQARPYLFGHGGDDGLSCLTCHEAHGSSNRRLLTHATSNDLCHTCHAVLESIHIEDPPSIFQNCLDCHTQVHGSNWNRALMR
jgi:DmsE family decaheme c-type cytochrome